jgi:surfactin synthase thioesterase subunit
MKETTSNVAGETAEAVDQNTDTRVVEIGKLLSRAAKNYQMYLSNNRMFTSSMEDLKGALEDYLEDEEVLTLVVKEFELVHQDTPVYSNNDKYQSLAFRMYRDGIRLISFHRGISGDDLLDFFDALARCMDAGNLEEDFVTLLWEKDLQTITYYEINDFDAEYRYLQDGVAKAMGDQGNADDLDNSDVILSQSTKKVGGIVPVLNLSDEDVKQVQNLTLPVEDYKFIERVWGVLKLTLEHCEDREVYVDLGSAVIGLIDLSVARRRLDVAAAVLEDARAVYGEFKDKAVSLAISMIVRSAHSEKNMAVIQDMLSNGNEAQHQRCAEYLSHLSGEGVPAVLRLLLICRQASAKQAVFSALLSVARKDPGHIVDNVDLSSPEEAEVVIDVLETVGTPASLGSALKLRWHASPMIRAKVAALAGQVESGQALETARDLLGDSDPAVRRNALSSLAEIMGEDALGHLVEMFTSNDFTELPHERKLSMLIVTRSLPPRGQKELMRVVFGMKGFLKRKQIEDTKVAMLEISHLLDRDTMRPFLEEIADRSSGRLNKAARAALEKIRDGQRKR